MEREGKRERKRERKRKKEGGKERAYLVTEEHEDVLKVENIVGVAHFRKEGKKIEQVYVVCIEENPS